MQRRKVKAGVDRFDCGLELSDGRAFRVASGLPGSGVPGQAIHDRDGDTAVVKEGCGTMPKSMEVPPLLVKPDIAAVATKPFRKCVTEPAIGAAGAEIGKDARVAHSSLLIDIIQQPNSDELPMDGHEPNRGLVLEVTRRPGVDVEKPNPFVLTDILGMKLADLLFAHS